jgi:puromycin-sensitive aminopeptidase
VVEIETTRGRDGLELSAHQRRFFYENVVDPDGDDEGALWHVPLSVKTATAAPTSTLMTGETTMMDVALPAVSPRGDWIKINPDQTAFYRTNYSEDDWARLKRGVDRLGLSSADRLGLQDDAYALARAGYLPATQFLSLAEAYVGEPEAPVWQDLSANLSGMERMLADEDFLPDYRAFCQGLYMRAAAKAGWHAKPGEGHLDALFRSTVLGGFGGYGDEDTLAQAAELFERLIGGGDVDPNVRTVVLTLAAEQGDRSTFDALWKLHRDATMEEQRVRVLVALSHIGDPVLLQETLDRSLTDEVRVHNTVRVVTNVALNLDGRDLAWEFLKANWEELDRRYGEGGFALMDLVSIAGRFTSQSRLDDVRRFFEEHPAPGADRSVRQALERVELNIAFLDRNRDGLAAWFGR